MLRVVGGRPLGEFAQHAARCVGGSARRTALATLLVLGAIGLSVPRLPDAYAESARRVTADGDVVVAPARYEGFADRILRLVPRVRKQVAERLGHVHQGQMGSVVLVADLQGARDVLGPGVPGWAAGVHRAGTIVLRADEVDRGAPLRTLATILRHEWVHLAWWRMAGPRSRDLPRWFEEGLAEDIGGGVSLEGGAELELAASFGNLLAFDDMRTSWPRQQTAASLAYRQSKDFVAWWRETHGTNALQALLSELADGRAQQRDAVDGPPIERWVFQETGTPLSVWTERWRMHLLERSRPWYQFFLRDLWSTLILLLAVFGLLSWWFVRRRRRRMLEAMPEHVGHDQWRVDG